MITHKSLRFFGYVATSLCAVTVFLYWMQYCGRTTASESAKGGDGKIVCRVGNAEIDALSHRTASKRDLNKSFPSDPFGVVPKERVVLTDIQRSEMLGRIRSMHKPLSPKDRDAATSVILKAVDADWDFAGALLAELDPESVVSILGKNCDHLLGFINDRPGTIMDIMDSAVWSNANGGALSAICQKLAADQPKLMVSWILSKNNTPFSTNLCKDMFSSACLAGCKPDEVLAMVNDISDPQYKLSAARGVLSIFGASNPAVADLVIKSLAPNDRNLALNDFICPFAIKNAGLAWEMLKDSQTEYEPDAIYRAAQNVARIQAGRDLDSAIQWVNDTEPGSLRVGAVTGLIITWSALDIQAATKWLAQFPYGDERTAGAEVIIDRIKDTDPEMAEQWRKSISSQVKE